MLPYKHFLTSVAIISADISKTSKNKPMNEILNVLVCITNLIRSASCFSLLVVFLSFSLCFSIFFSKGDTCKVRISLLFLLYIG